MRNIWLEGRWQKNTIAPWDTDWIDVMRMYSAMAETCAQSGAAHFLHFYWVSSPIQLVHSTESSTQKRATSIHARQTKRTLKQTCVDSGGQWEVQWKRNLTQSRGMVEGSARIKAAFSAAIGTKNSCKAEIARHNHFNSLRWPFFRLKHGKLHQGKDLDGSEEPKLGGNNLNLPRKLSQ